MSSSFNTIYGGNFSGPVSQIINSNRKTKKKKRSLSATRAQRSSDTVAPIERAATRAERSSDTVAPIERAATRSAMSSDIVVEAPAPVCTCVAGATSVSVKIMPWWHTSLCKFIVSGAQKGHGSLIEASADGIFVLTAAHVVENSDALCQFPGVDELFSFVACYRAPAKYDWVVVKLGDCHAVDAENDCEGHRQRCVRCGLCHSRTIVACAVAAD
jgi:hypothetical protein